MHPQMIRRAGLARDSGRRILALKRSAANRPRDILSRFQIE
jgi:hypothetical protein